MWPFVGLSGRLFSLGKVEESLISSRLSPNNARESEGTLRMPSSFTYDSNAGVIVSLSNSVNVPSPCGYISEFPILSTILLKKAVWANPRPESNDDENTAAIPSSVLMN